MEIPIMSGVVPYFLMLGTAFGVALVLFFGLRAVKLI
jgi:Cytochrome B6-F complex subunit VI (PetL)